MFAVGHMALAYLAGKISAKPLRVSPNVPLLLVLSIIPDMDILVGEGFHRGPTHSVIMAIIVFLPVLYFYRRKAVPYLLALASLFNKFYQMHRVISDNLELTQARIVLVKRLKEVFNNGLVLLGITPLEKM